jgi:hypothetical protein
MKLYFQKLNLEAKNTRRDVRFLQEAMPLALMVELLSQLPFYKAIFFRLIKRYSGQQDTSEAN